MIIPHHRRARLPWARGAALVLLAGLLGGCVYRMNIQQGNYLEGKTVDQLEVGMTRTQVRYLLGTPMVPDAFDKDRWDYLYYFQSGKRLRKPDAAPPDRVLQGRQGDQVRARQRARERAAGARPGRTDRQVPEDLARARRSRATRARRALRGSRVSGRYSSMRSPSAHAALRAHGSPKMPTAACSQGTAAAAAPAATRAAASASATLAAASSSTVHRYCRSRVA